MEIVISIAVGIFAGSLICIEMNRRVIQQNCASLERIIANMGTQPERRKLFAFENKKFF
jgi:hypothetical protein